MSGVDQFPDFIKQMTEADLPFPAAKGWLLQGGGEQVVFIEFGDAADVPEHSHQEQWEFVIAGSVVLRVEGNDNEYGPGENFFIPAQVPHSAQVSEGYRAVVVFNSPDRYRSKSSE